MTDPKEPCSNFDECLECYDEPFFIVSTTRIESRTHERRIRAKNTDEALRIYNEGTAWPSDYDDTNCSVISEEPTQIVIEDSKRTAQRWDAIKDTACYHHLDDALPEGGGSDPDLYPAVQL